MGQVLAGFINAQVKAETRAAGGRGGRGAKSRRGPRSKQLCYFPGCKNIAAPRYGMFCVAEHKDLSKAEKEKYRGQHEKGSKPAAAAKRGRAKK